MKIWKTVGLTICKEYEDGGNFILYQGCSLLEKNEANASLIQAIDLLERAINQMCEGRK